MEGSGERAASEEASESGPPEQVRRRRLAKNSPAPSQDRTPENELFSVRQGAASRAMPNRRRSPGVDP